MVCDICMERLMPDGDHMPAELPRCGHMAGRSCLVESVRRYGRCFMCADAARPEEVRALVSEVLVRVLAGESQTTSTRSSMSAVFGDVAAEGGATEQAFHVKIITLSGGTFKVPLAGRQQTLVSQLKTLINQHEGVPANQQTLLYAGQQLVDNFALANYNIQHGSTIHLVARLVGGSACGN